MAEGSVPNANRKNGVSKEELACATRTYFKEHYPEKLSRKRRRRA